MTGRVEQLRVWELSCILRAPTVHGDVYLKATRESPLVVNEAAVTRELAALFPDHVPAPWPWTPSAAGWRWPTSGRS